jgi:spoIIIJ-associated protein
VSAITSRQLGFRYPVIVDIEGYRHRRRQKLEDIARRSADRAAQQKTSVRLRPMTAYERRIVHVALRDDHRVATGSEGEDPFRMVVISPK